MPIIEELRNAAIEEINRCTDPKTLDLAWQILRKARGAN